MRHLFLRASSLVLAFVACGAAQAADHWNVEVDDSAIGIGTFQNINTTAYKGWTANLSTTYDPTYATDNITGVNVPDYAQCQAQTYFAFAGFGYPQLPEPHNPPTLPYQSVAVQFNYQPPPSPALPATTPGPADPGLVVVCRTNDAFYHVNLGGESAPSVNANEWLYTTPGDQQQWNPPLARYNSGKDHWQTLCVVWSGAPSTGHIFLYNFAINGLSGQKTGRFRYPRRAAA